MNIRQRYKPFLEQEYKRVKKLMKEAEEAVEVSRRRTRRLEGTVRKFQNDLAEIKDKIVEEIIVKQQRQDEEYEYEF